MTVDRPDHPTPAHVLDAADEALLDAWLANELDDAQSVAFETRLDAEPALAAAAAGQRAIDDALRRGYAPDPDALRLDGASSAADAGARPTGGRRWLAVAASIAMLLVAGGLITVAAKNMLGNPWRVSGGGENERYPDANRVMTVAAAYERLISKDFTPDWVCTVGDSEWTAAYTTELGFPLVADLGPRTGAPDVRGLGLAHRNTISSRSVWLLAMVEDDPVVLIAAKTDQLRPFAIESLGDGMQLFTDARDGYTLFEYTPRPAPALLDRFERATPDASSAEALSEPAS